MTTSKIDKIITDIAAKTFGTETLESRHSDRLDFHSVSVLDIKTALLAAYQAGQQNANKAVDNAGINADATRRIAECLRLVDNVDIAAAVRGEVDMAGLFTTELASRGYDQNCTWVGFARAKSGTQ